jgi:hypothetical protein
MFFHYGCFMPINVEAELNCSLVNVCAAYFVAVLHSSLIWVYMRVRSIRYFLFGLVLRLSGFTLIYPITF